MATIIFAKSLPESNGFLKKFDPKSLAIRYLSLLISEEEKGTRLVFNLSRVPWSIPKSTAIQFSIRQWMIVTAAIAKLFAIARSLGETREESIVNLFTPCLAAAPLLATWAMLTVGRLWLRIPVVLAISLISGLLPLFLTPDAAPDNWFWPSITFAQAIFSLATLVVVRSWGYRLLRTPEPTE